VVHVLRSPGQAGGFHPALWRSLSSPSMPLIEDDTRGISPFGQNLGSVLLPAPSPCIQNWPALASRCSRLPAWAAGHLDLIPYPPRIPVSWTAAIRQCAVLSVQPPTLCCCCPFGSAPLGSQRESFYLGGPFFIL
jgi:hypothetical protein